LDQHGVFGLGCLRHHDAGAENSRQDECASHGKEFHLLPHDWFLNFAVSTPATACGTKCVMSPPIEAIWRTSVAVMVRTDGLAGRKTVWRSGAIVSFMPAICIS